MKFQNLVQKVDDTKAQKEYGKIKEATIVEPNKSNDS